MPLVRSLEVLARQERNPALRRVELALAEDIRAGRSASRAMEKHPRVFDRLALNMVRAGEAGGSLEAALDRLATFQEKSMKLRGRIRAALFYPVVVMSVALLILVGLLLFVVPKFKQIFAELLKGASLPTLTQAVLSVSEYVRHHAGQTLLLFVGVASVFAFVRRTVWGQRMSAVAVLKVPLFGDLILKSIVARFGRTLGTLLSSGVPILPALLIARDTCDNVRVARAIMTVHDAVKGGAPVARPLDETRVFPPMVVGMVEVGEHSGQLAAMLGKVADVFEEEVDNAVAGLSSLIEPVMILFLAGVVGTIVLALFLPIIRIVQLLT